MDFCARNLEEIFSTKKVSAETGIPISVWHDACGKLRAHLKKHYSDVPTWEHEPIVGAPMWPLVAIPGRCLKKHDQLHVGITAEQAKRWESIR